MQCTDGLDGLLLLQKDHGTMFIDSLHSHQVMFKMLVNLEIDNLPSGLVLVFYISLQVHLIISKVIMLICGKI